MTNLAIKLLNKAARDPDGVVRVSYTLDTRNDKAKGAKKVRALHGLSKDGLVEGFTFAQMTGPVDCSYRGVIECTYSATITEKGRCSRPQ